MANIKSQIKRNRTNEKARLRNQSVKSQLKTFTRRFREAVESGDRGTAEQALLKASRAYDKAAAAGVIHANNAANHKSKLQRALNKVSA